MEQAQVLWQRALDLVHAVDPDERFAAVLELLRAAKHDSTTIAHALAIGRTHLRVDAGDSDATRGVNALERAAAFLGVKPAMNAASGLRLL